MLIGGGGGLQGYLLKFAKSPPPQKKKKKSKKHFCVIFGGIFFGQNLYVIRLFKENDSTCTQNIPKRYFISILTCSNLRCNILHLIQTPVGVHNTYIVLGPWANFGTVWLLYNLELNIAFLDNVDMYEKKINYAKE